MGDYRIDIVIKLTGADGKQRKREAWLNWDKEETPRKVVNMLETLALESQLQFVSPSDI